MITATVLTKNNEKTLKKTLESLTDFAEVIVLDSGSTDETLSIAKSFPNVSVHHSPFMGFGPMHNYAAKLAKHDWIFSIDSDEFLSQELRDEIKALSLDSECTYRMGRKNFFNKKHIKYCSGWNPDFVIRIYHRKQTGFSDDLVHEKVLQKELKLVSLNSPLHHTPYLEIGDFLHKMQHYSELFAKQTETEEKISIFHALFHSWFAFFKSYILKWGIFGGKEGFIISLYQGHTAFYKYLKLAERQEKEL